MICTTRSRTLAVGGGAAASERVLNRNTATFEILEVVEFDGAGGAFDSFKVDVAEPISIRHNVSNYH